MEEGTERRDAGFLSIRRQFAAPPPEIAAQGHGKPGPRAMRIGAGLSIGYPHRLQFKEKKEDCIKVVLEPNGTT